MTKETPKQRQRRAAIKAERFKMLAGGTQLLAVGVLGASIIAPTFNSAQQFSVLLAGGGGITAALIELVAWVLMSYAVPRAETDQEDTNA